MLIKKIIAVLLLVNLSLFTVHSIGEGDISALSAVVINADTKEILYEKNAYDRRSMASTTKIMTSILAIESGRLSDEVTATSSVLTEGTSIGLKSGYVLTLQSLVYGMLLESGNDAANLSALYLGESYDGFSALMNSKAKEIGMNDTSFVTPSGLDDENHYTTAYDMAVLGAYCIKNPVFAKMCSAESKTVEFVKPEKSITFYNHNKLLDTCEGVFGIKTGFTKKSGRCLVSACERDGATLICVTLNAGDDWNDHKKLYDMCYADLNKDTVKSIDFDTVKVYGSLKKEISVKCEDYVYHYKNSDNGISVTVKMPKILYAPIEKNDIIGKAEYIINGEVVHTSYICADETVYSAQETYNNKFSLLNWLKNIFKQTKGI